MFEILTYALAKSKAAKEVKAAVSGKLDKPANPTIGQLLRVKSISDDGDIVLETVDGGGGSWLPDGGTAGQVLAKKSDADGDTEWADFIVKLYISNNELFYADGSIFDSTAIDFNKIYYFIQGTDVYLSYVYSNGYLTFRLWRNISDTSVGVVSYSAYKSKVSRIYNEGYLIPRGGATAQILAKKSSANGDTQWVDPQTATVRTVMDDVTVSGSKYFLGEQTALSITMPTDAQTGQEILVVFSSGATPCTLSINLDDFDYVPKANTTCKITFTCIAADTWLVDVKEG